MLCLNLGELPPERIWSEPALTELVRTVEEGCGSIERLYVGSSFCSQYFLQFRYMNEVRIACRRYNWKMTLTVPIITQKDLDVGKALIERWLIYCEEVIDEITCNDLGMLSYLSDKTHVRLNMGPLFFRDPRDPRYVDYSERITPAKLTHELPKGVSCVELSPVARRIFLPDTAKQPVQIAIHQPFCFISTGNICKYASIPLTVDHKFRPNTPCSRQCASIAEVYEETGDALWRLGRTVYTLMEKPLFPARKPDRIIYWPVREVCLEGSTREYSGAN